MFCCDEESIEAGSTTAVAYLTLQDDRNTGALNKQRDRAGLCTIFFISK